MKSGNASLKDFQIMLSYLFLKKVVLGIVKDQIKPINLKRWKQVSMIERVKFQMPSCTNQVESMHGHLNIMVTRRNEFERSVKKIIDTIIR